MRVCVKRIRRGRIRWSECWNPTDPNDPPAKPHCPFPDLSSSLLPYSNNSCLKDKMTPPISEVTYLALREKRVVHPSDRTGQGNRRARHGMETPNQGSTGWWFLDEGRGGSAESVSVSMGNKLTPPIGQSRAVHWKCPTMNAAPSVGRYFRTRDTTGGMPPICTRVRVFHHSPRLTRLPHTYLAPRQWEPTLDDQRVGNILSPC